MKLSPKEQAEKIIYAVKLELHRSNPQNTFEQNNDITLALEYGKMSVDRLLKHLEEEIEGFYEEDFINYWKEVKKELHNYYYK